MSGPLSICTFLQKSPFADLARVSSRTSVAIILFCLSAMWFPTEGAMAQNHATALAKRPEVLRAFPLTRFYDTPGPLPPGKPGELIRFEPLGDHELPFAVTVVRILYHSRSAKGKDIAVSGVVLVPPGAAPTGGWPVIAWAHDFKGAARQCAPSLMKNLSAGPFLAMYTNLGYAVVATDYAGLGTNFPYTSLDMQSSALDVIYSVPASRTAAPQLGLRWVAMGYSQGGLAAVGVAEAESEIRDGNYLGAVAISGVADVHDIYQRMSLASSGRFLFSLARTIKNVFPDFRVQDMLAVKAMQLYEQTSHSCDATAEAELPPGEVLKPGWENDRFVEDFFTRNTPGRKPASGPLLILGGEADPAVPASITPKAVARMCKQGDRVLFYKYPDLDAGALLGGSVSDQISWVKARFAGRRVPSNCP
jgi:alpha-beta hydrolase superfamily lysophospholipase